MGVAVSELIRTRREELGLTQAQLGGLLGASATGVAGLEARELTENLTVNALRTALTAMGLELFLTTVELDRPSEREVAETAARNLAEEVAESMELSGHPLSPENVEQLYQQALRRELEADGQADE